MQLNWKIRTTLGVMRVLTAMRLLPTNQRAVKMPAEKRIATKPPKFMVGDVPEVATEDHQVRTRDGQEIRVRIYRPEIHTRTLLYAHGGGWIFGGIPACDHICRRLAAEADVAVVSVEYRLAPEHPFPVPLDDVEDAMDWLRASGRESSVLLVGGDSAGGNLAAALTLRTRTRGIPVAGQLLVYPAVDATVTRPGLLAYDGPGMTPADCRFIADVYLAGADPRNPEASPVCADSHAGLPPAFVVTVEYDALRDDGIAYADALRAAGVPVRHVDVPGHVHGSLSLPALYDGIDELYAGMCAFLADPTTVHTAAS